MYQFLFARFAVVVEIFNVDFNFGIRSYLYVELYPLCHIDTGRIVVSFAAVSQVGLLRDSSFDALYARVNLSWLRMELLPSVGIVLN